MLLKTKNQTRRKDSHGRDSSHLRSSSRSQERSQSRSQSRQLRGRAEGEEGQLKKVRSAKELEATQQYYPQLGVRTKSRGRQMAAGQEANRAKYLTSVYMHKNGAVGQGDAAENSSRKAGVLQKFRVLERHCGIDANGRIQPKEPLPSSELDSQHTVSISETTRLEKRKRERPHRDPAKNKRTEGARLSGVKSSQKGVRRQDRRSPGGQEGRELLRGVRPEQDLLRGVGPQPRGPSVVMWGKGVGSLQETRSSPTQDTSEPVALPPQDDLAKEIRAELQDILDPQQLKRVFEGQLLQERTRSVEVLRRLCAGLGARREALSLAVVYLDRYSLLAGSLTSRQVRLVALTSLLLALKIEDGIMARKLWQDYSQRAESLLQSPSKTRSQQKPGSKTKMPNERNRDASALLALELQMALRLGFRLRFRSCIFWADLLTAVWDQGVGRRQGLLFRAPGNTRTISHLYQVLDGLVLSLEASSFPRPHLVLSAIYLVVRAQLEEEQGERRPYARLAEGLLRSSNLVFIDRAGTNQLFGDFLEGLELTLCQLVDSIRFVGQQLQEGMRLLAFQARGRRIDPLSHEHRLALCEPLD